MVLRIIIFCLREIPSKVTQGAHCLTKQLEEEGRDREEKSNFPKCILGMEEQQQTIDWTITSLIVCLTALCSSSRSGTEREAREMKQIGPR